MKAKNLILSILTFGFIIIPAKSQKVYPVTSGEIIFSQNQAAFTSDFLQQYPGASLVGSNLRFTMVIQVGQYMHLDINNNLGFYTGLAIRNIGMITDETLPQTVTLTNQAVNYTNYNIVRRQYTLGVPLALKLGSFKDHFYLFGGGEYELAFAYKEKYWTDTFDRSGSKTKLVTWFGSQTPTFLPSVFGGIQFPGGFNVKFTYYLTDFLNSGYKKSNNNQEGAIYNISDLSRYQKSQIFFISVCWQFNTSTLTRQF